jgi:predicted permease
VTAIREPLVWGTILGSVFLALGWTVPDWLGHAIDLGPVEIHFEFKIAAAA